MIQREEIKCKIRNSIENWKIPVLRNKNKQGRKPRRTYSKKMWEIIWIHWMLLTILKTSKKVAIWSMFFDISKNKKYSLSSKEAGYTDANQASYNYQTSQKK